jgi:hypothetical protein
MMARQEIVQKVTPQEVVDATDDTILAHDLVGDDWVANTWRAHSKADWVADLAANEGVLRKVLDQKIRIHASKVLPWATWVEVIKHFEYLKQREAEVSPKRM